LFKILTEPLWPLLKGNWYF